MLEIAPKVLELGLSSAALVVRGVDNSRTSPALVAYRRAAARNLAAYWKNRSISAHPAVREYHKTHRLVGVADQSPAPEKLILYIRRHRDLTASGAVVDCYNLVSAKTLLSIGAHDLCRLATPVTLRFASPVDLFIPLDQTERQQITGEYAYIDQAGRVICRLDVLQCDHSKVTPESSDIVFFLQGNRCLPATTLLKGAWLLAEMIETFCGGEAELVAFHDAGPIEATTPAKPPIPLEEFKKLDLRAGTIVRAEELPTQNALAVVTVALGQETEALAPSSVLGDDLVGQRVIVASDLHPLRVAGMAFTSYVLSAQHGRVQSLSQLGPGIPDGRRLY